MTTATHHVINRPNKDKYLPKKSFLERAHLCHASAASTSWEPRQTSRACWHWAAWHARRRAARCPGWRGRWGRSPGAHSTWTRGPCPWTESRSAGGREEEDNTIDGDLQHGRSSTGLKVMVKNLSIFYPEFFTTSFFSPPLISTVETNPNLVI